MNSNRIIIYSALAATIGIILSTLRLKQRKRKRRTWCRNWLQRRNERKDILDMLNNELLPEDPTSYNNFLRLSNDQFEYILSLIKPIISKQDTVMCECIPAPSKLEVTLRFLATGESYGSLMYATRIHETTISKFVPAVCSAIVSQLKEMYLRAPSTPEGWKEVAQKYESLWQFPHCIGALDGRHITFRAPISSGSYYYNYKGAKSIVLLGLVDAKYRFIHVNVGVNGRISDGGVFHNRKLSEALQRNTLNLAAPEILPGLTESLPFVIVADDAFPLSKTLMKPYPERGLNKENRIFNYRLSKARRIVENAFGILVNRFRILLNPIDLNADKVELLSVTCVILHNYLATENSNTYILKFKKMVKISQE